MPHSFGLSTKNNVLQTQIDILGIYTYYLYISLLTVCPCAWAQAELITPMNTTGVY